MENKPISVILTSEEADLIWNLLARFRTETHTGTNAYMELQTAKAIHDKLNEAAEAAGMKKRSS